MVLVWSATRPPTVHPGSCQARDQYQPTALGLGTPVLGVYPRETHAHAEQKTWLKLVIEVLYVIACMCVF